MSLISEIRKLDLRLTELDWEIAAVIVDHGHGHLDGMLVARREALLEERSLLIDCLNRDAERSSYISATQRSTFSATI